MTRNLDTNVDSLCCVPSFLSMVCMQDARLSHSNTISSYVLYIYSYLLPLMVDGVLASDLPDAMRCATQSE